MDIDVTSLNLKTWIHIIFSSFSIQKTSYLQQISSQLCYILFLKTASVCQASPSRQQVCSYGHRCRDLQLESWVTLWERLSRVRSTLDTHSPSQLCVIFIPSSSSSPVSLQHRKPLRRKQHGFFCGCEPLIGCNNQVVLLWQLFFPLSSPFSASIWVEHWVMNSRHISFKCCKSKLKVRHFADQTTRSAFQAVLRVAVAAAAWQRYSLRQISLRRQSASSHLLFSSRACTFTQMRRILQVITVMDAGMKAAVHSF